MSRHHGFLLLCLVVKYGFLVAQQQQQVLFRDLAPPAFHTGSVFHSFSGSPSDDADLTNLNLPHFDGMTATIYMSYGGWNAVNAAITTSSWTKVVDKLKASNDKLIHGHVLVYPNNNLQSAWWQQQRNSLVESRMNKYIDTVVLARRGKIWIWDVVIEAMADDGDDMDQDGVRTKFANFRPIKEYQAMGQSYIAKAFQRARINDPNALLLLSDYGCEEDDPTNNNEKSDRLFRFMTKLKSQKVRIDGVGLQFHVSSLPGKEPNYARIVQNFERFRNAGFSIFITEMDVKSYETASPATVSSTDLQAAAERQALVYSRILKICLNEPACKCLFMWDIADYNSRNPSKQFSWYHPYDDGSNSVPLYYYPTPFWDISPDNFAPKPAWYAMQDAMASFTGVYRVTSLWTPATSYLSRSGVSGNPTTPSNGLYLATLNAQSNVWTSLKWRFERVEVGIYRIACTWDLSTGYLTRSATQDPNTLEWNPGDTLYVAEFQSSWWSQQWYVEYVYDNQYRIRNRWGDDGSLTRLGEPDQNGNIVPTNQVYLDAANPTWTSQIWRLERVWSDSDTKTAADKFWL